MKNKVPIIKLGRKYYRNFFSFISCSEKNPITIQSTDLEPSVMMPIAVPYQKSQVPSALPNEF